MMQPTVHYGGINPEGESATINLILVVLKAVKAVGDGVTLLAHAC